MSIAETDRIICRAVAEPAFRELLLSGSERAFRDYELTTTERRDLSLVTRAGLHALVGGVVTHRLIPLRVGQRFVVLPVFAAYDSAPTDVPIVLGPDWAFGNGVHPTTVLSLSAIDAYLRPGDSLLDLGTGTGILSIAAARLGASPVLALDIDAGAVEAARRNAAYNRVADIVKVGLGSLAEAFETTAEQWDMVVVNIEGSVVLRMLQLGLANAIRKEGILIASGLKAIERDSMCAALHGLSFNVLDESRCGAWHTLVARKSGASRYRTKDLMNRAVGDQPSASPSARAEC